MHIEPFVDFAFVPGVVDCEAAEFCRAVEVGATAGLFIKILDGCPQGVLCG